MFGSCCKMYLRCSFCCAELGGAVTLATVTVCVCVSVFVCVPLSDQTWSLSHEHQLHESKIFVILDLKDVFIILSLLLYSDHCSLFMTFLLNE